MEPTTPAEKAKKILDDAGLKGDDLVALGGLIADAIQAERDMFAARVQVLDWQPGDVLVLTYKSKLSDAAHEHIRKVLSTMLPGIEALILAEGMGMDRILRRDEAGHEEQ